MWQYALGAGANLLGGAMNAYGQWQGAKAAGQAINQGIKDVNASSTAMSDEQKGLQQPWISGGKQGFTDLQNFRMRDPGTFQNQAFGGVNMQEDPGVQYRMGQAQKSLDTSLAGKGVSMGGMAAKAMAEQQQNLGSQEFNNAYQRQYGQFNDLQNANRQQFNTEADRNMNLDQFRMNQLQNISNMGQGATNTLGSSLQGIGTNRMSTIANLQGQLADVNATRAGAPWSGVATGMQSGGNMMGDWGSYLMGRGNANKGG